MMEKGNSNMDCHSNCTLPAKSKNLK